MENLNLNQMGALDVLLEERNVRRAAERYRVTQSAMSHTLRQLRETLGDALLVRSGNRMVPTPRAEAIRIPLHQALTDLRSAVEMRPVFDPPASTRRFVIACSDAVAVTLIPTLCSDLARLAPHVELELRSVGVERVPEYLEAGDVDVLVSPARPNAAGIRTQVLYTSGGKVLCRARHPDIGGELDLDTYCRLPHATIGAGRGAGLVDRVLAKIGRERRVTLCVPYFMALPAILARTNHLVTLPDGLSQHLARARGLQQFDPPVSLPGTRIHAAWHERFQAEPGATWLRQRIQAAAAMITGQTRKR